MAENEEPKKESLEEILSDLNSILDKMPEMMDGAKPPEGAAEAACLPPETDPSPEAAVTPAEPPAALPETMDADGNFERMIDLKDLGAAAPPAAKNETGTPDAAPEPAAFDPDKTLVIQSLGESMFSGGAEEPPAVAPPAQPEPAAEPMPAPEAGTVPEQEKEPAAGPKEQAPPPDNAFIMDFGGDSPEAQKEAAAQAGSSPFAMTRDFGIPDIDMLLQMSGAGASAPQAGNIPAPEPAAAAPAEQAAPEIEAAPVQAEAAPVDSFVIEPAPEIEAAPVQAEAAPAAESSPVDSFIIESPAESEAAAVQAEAEAESPVLAADAAESALAEEMKGLDGLIIGQEPGAESVQGQAQQETQPGVEPGGPAAEGLVLPALSGAEGSGAEGSGAEGSGAEGSGAEGPAPSAGPLELPAGQAGGDNLLVLGNAAAGGTPAAAPAPRPEEENNMLILPSGAPPEGTPLTFATPEAPPALGTLDGVEALTIGAPQPEEEKTMLILPSGSPQPQEETPLTLAAPEAPPAFGTLDGVEALTIDAPQPEEEKTMLLVPGGGPQPEAAEEKTIVMMASDMDATSRNAPRADFAELSAKPTPDAIPENRRRTLALLYVEEDKDLCAQVLAELDSICTKSASKPMFITRGFVKLCEVGMNGNFVLQMATDAKANGLLCVGSIPQETVYEIENALTSSGLMFKHVQRDNFSHSAMLDVVTELILK